MMDRWKDWKVDELRQFLKDRGVEYGKRNKDELLELCTLAAETNTEFDPGGIRDDIRSVIVRKLLLDNGDSLPLPSTSEGTGDISFIPAITVIDIYNFLLPLGQYDHAMLQNYHKIKMYTMHQDGFVLDVQGVKWSSHPGFVAVKAKVKPRTRDKDQYTQTAILKIIPFAQAQRYLVHATDEIKLNLHCTM